jgi:hypothetical protein
MTRINAGINPQLLSSKHLIAEHREIKRIPNVVAKKGFDPNTIPDNFCLGKGHVKFFYNKLGYLYFRYMLIYEECIRRGFNVTFYGDAWDSVQMEPFDLMWWPHPKDAELVAQRINERLGLPLELGIANWHRIENNSKKSVTN